MKKLPKGIQNITELLGEDFIYVDKTPLIIKLIKANKHSFISRPRRFGKSLFLSTLEQIFKGNKELFKNCAIYSSDYAWDKHPVLHLDFSRIPNRDPQNFEEALRRKLEQIATERNLSIEAPTAMEVVELLIKQLSKQAKVVILVDEYDKPIINHLADIEVANQNRDILRDFFGTLKGLDAYIKFTLITGVSKFSQVSLFSGPNYLSDITMDPAYATMMGYTDEEVKHYFAPYIQKIAKVRNLTEGIILDEVKTWYNGYCFARDSNSVYNPYSTLNYMDAGLPESYWYRSGTPSFLIDQVKKHPQSLVPISGASALKNTLMDIGNLQRISLIALMFQTGYLTLTSYDQETDIYHLDFPNKEVHNAFFNSLLEDFAEIDPTLVITQAKHLQTAIKNHHFETFVEIINVYFAKVPYELFTGACESFYHALFLTFLERSGLRTVAEVSTNIGRIDLVAEYENTLYVFELKLDKSADIAFDQAQTKRYKERFTFDHKTLVVIGINFSSKTRNIADWKAKLFSPLGKLLSLSSKKALSS